MLKASLFSGRSARFLALSTIVGGALLLAGLYVAPTQSCPGPPPQPLRQLYMQSERVVIARVGKSEIVKVENNGDDREVETDDEDGGNGPTQLRTALHVSSTLKGEHQPVVYVNHYMYVDYKDPLSSAPTDEDLLVFLEKVEDIDDFSVDMNYGIKKLSKADLNVYVSRIEELASMMKSGYPGDAAIVEWLVRCAEEPATQWEGTYELAVSQQLLEESARENSTSDTAEVEISEGQSDEMDVESVSVKDINEVQISFGRSVALVKSNFARILTIEQRNRIMNALVAKTSLTDAEYFLLDLTSRWDDPRFVPYLLSQLDLASRSGKEVHMSSYFAENVMNIVANKLGDETLTAIVANFSARVYQDDEKNADDVEVSREGAIESETRAEQIAAREAAIDQRRNAEMQHFVTLALSTVPQAPIVDSVGTADSAQP